ncbi:MAG: OadG family protein [Alistipes sp.]|nr:OadG family protein [Alistipes sp.]
MLWIALISICLVFTTLVLLIGVMKLFGYIFSHKKPVTTAATVSGSPIAHTQLHEDEVAAIMTALRLYMSAFHDRESEVLTIHSIKRAYSPWNSKIHGLTDMPNKK